MAYDLKMYQAAAYPVLSVVNLSKNVLHFPLQNYPADIHGSLLTWYKLTLEAYPTREYSSPFLGDLPLHS